MGSALPVEIRSTTFSPDDGRFVEVPLVWPDPTQGQGNVTQCFCIYLKNPGDTKIDVKPLLSGRPLWNRNSNIERIEYPSGMYEGDSNRLTLLPRGTYESDNNLLKLLPRTETRIKVWVRYYDRYPFTFTFFGESSEGPNTARSLQWARDLITNAVDIPSDVDPSFVRVLLNPKVVKEKRQLVELGWCTVTLTYPHLPDK